MLFQGDLLKLADEEYNKQGRWRGREPICISAMFLFWQVNEDSIEERLSVWVSFFCCGVAKMCCSWGNTFTLQVWLQGLGTVIVSRCSRQVGVVWLWRKGLQLWQIEVNLANLIYLRLHYSTLIEIFETGAAWNNCVQMRRALFLQFFLWVKQNIDSRGSPNIYSIFI